MAENSTIEWTHHTFNPWWGCTKVSPACTHCYAETWSRRVGLKVWGATAERRPASDKYWGEPLRWNRVAEAQRERKRVFCASMADVFEDRPELDGWRTKLCRLIGATPWLDWLLLTKRPENATRMVSWGSAWPENVWLGATVENQRWAEERVPHLLAVPAAIHFLSCEPLLGPIDLSPWICKSARTERRSRRSKIDWVIVGGESGHHARPMHPAWARALRDQATTRGTAFHFKQWGNWAPRVVPPSPALRLVVLDTADVVLSMDNVGKKAAGRTLDGRTWDEFPNPVERIAARTA